MKPFFSIRIDYNPADSEDIVACDQNSLRLVIGREVEWDGGRRSTDSLLAIVEKSVEALRWLGSKADTLGEQGFFECLFSELNTQCPEVFAAAVADVVTHWDETEQAVFEAAKEAAIKRDNETLLEDSE